MSSYGASFVRAYPDKVTSWRELSRLLREANASWLAESPTNFAVELIVRATEESDWFSIQKALADQLLETISRILGTTAITIYVMDEMVLRFSYRHFDNGQAVRALEYVDHGNPRERGKWTKVEGEPEPWEAILFSDRLMELYRKHAPGEVHGSCAEGKIKPGSSIPWACNAGTVAEIVDALQLPWDPIGNRFSSVTQTEVIPGSPERLHAFLRRKWRP